MIECHLFIFKIKLQKNVVLDVDFTVLTEVIGLDQALIQFEGNVNGITITIRTDFKEDLLLLNSNLEPE